MLLRFDVWYNLYHVEYAQKREREKEWCQRKKMEKKWMAPWGLRCVKPHERAFSGNCGGIENPDLL